MNELMSVVKESDILIIITKDGTRNLSTMKECYDWFAEIGEDLTYGETYTYWDEANNTILYFEGNGFYPYYDEHLEPLLEDMDENMDKIREVCCSLNGIEDVYWYIYGMIK